MGGGGSIKYQHTLWRSTALCSPVFIFIIMSGDLIVASFEVDRESSSFGFPFCAQVRKYFISFVFLRKNCRENNRKLRISIFIPTQRNPSFLSLKLRSFLMSWILYFMWVIRVLSKAQSIFFHFLCQLFVSSTFRWQDVLHFPWSSSLSFVGLSEH